MFLPKLAAFGLVSLLALGTISALADDPPAIVVDPAIAAMTPDQKVAARQDAMKQDGMLLRRAGRASGEDAVTIATQVLQNFTNFPALFADGATNDESDALPAIWTDFDQFTSMFDEGRLAATKMREAAISGDTGLYGDALRALGSVCGECHQMYRGM